MDQDEDLKNHNQSEVFFTEGELEVSTQNELSTFDLIVGHIEDILIDVGFQEMQHDFFEKYWAEFDNADENKLTYTPIFEEYVCNMETYIETKLKQVIPELNLDFFLEQVKRRQSSLDGELFEMLFSLSDFCVFKQLMLDYKAMKEGLVEDLASNLIVSSVRRASSSEGNY